jgi:branched-chain amino acid transport system permease protein
LSSAIRAHALLSNKRMFIDLAILANVSISGVLTGLVYGLMALGLSVIFGVVRVVNFAHGELMAVAMYVAALLFASAGLDPFVSVIPVALLFFVFGYLFQRTIIQPFVTRPDYAQFILLLAVAIIITNLLLIIFGPDAHSVYLDYLLEPIEIGALVIDRGKLYAAAVALGAAAALFAFFRLTLTGTAIRACADNHTGALVVGLDVRHLYALTFGLGAACVGAAGAMMVLLVEVTPALGPAYTLLAFVIVITGGLGSMPGALLGGVLIGFTEAMAGLLFTPSAKSMFGFAILALVLLFRPQGILGRAPR